MSDDVFPEQPELMGPVRARNIARSLKQLAQQYADARMPVLAARTMHESQWWLTYSLSLQQTPPGAIDPWSETGKL